MVFFSFLSWAPKKGTKEGAKGDRGDSSDKRQAFVSPHKPLSPFGIPLHPLLPEGSVGEREFVFLASAMRAWWKKGGLQSPPLGSPYTPLGQDLFAQSVKGL